MENKLASDGWQSQEDSARCNLFHGTEARKARHPKEFHNKIPDRGPWPY